MQMTSQRDMGPALRMAMLPWGQCSAIILLQVMPWEQLASSIPIAEKTKMLCVGAVTIGWAGPETQVTG